MFKTSLSLYGFYSFLFHKPHRAKPHPSEIRNLEKARSVPPNPRICHASEYDFTSSLPSVSAVLTSQRMRLRKQSDSAVLSEESV